jgi:hypothetical protein
VAFIRRRTIAHDESRRNASKTMETFIVATFGRCVRMVAAAERDTVGYSGDAMNLTQRRGNAPPNDA